MKLQYIAPVRQEPVYKASVHRTGKIAFTIESAKKFDITADKAMILAINADDENDISIYGILTDINDENGYKIHKAGKYHSVNAKGFFDTLKMIYYQGDISFTITETSVDGVQVLKFTPKEPIPIELPF